MSISLTAVIIVAILVSGVVRLARIQHGTDRQSRRGGTTQPLLDPAQPSPRELELQNEVKDLRERIHVLERIATDGRPAKALAAEIESLRDA
ncbi:hypothetical protein [Novosphingobium sp.]|uniref:hypothetical protein n=1 Tax=Novosphingobium sp. TaxID=1874826 RepID=UPI0025CCDA36|nr:hypothetical protein [Novosphingobium sp.]MCC6925180.1 hypothetical protein [Novosphingobium sp.]